MEKGGVFFVSTFKGHSNSERVRELGQNQVCPFLVDLVWGLG